MICSYIFPAGLLESIRLLKPLGLVSKLLYVLFHLLILTELLTQVIHELSQETFTSWSISHLMRQTEGRTLVGQTEAQIQWTDYTYFHWSVLLHPSVTLNFVTCINPSKLHKQLIIFFDVIDIEFVPFQGKSELSVCTCTAAAGLPRNLEASPLHTEEARDREEKAKARLPTNCNGEKVTVSNKHQLCQLCQHYRKWRMSDQWLMGWVLPPQAWAGT